MACRQVGGESYRQGQESHSGSSPFRLTSATKQPGTLKALSQTRFSPFLHRWSLRVGTGEGGKATSLAGEVERWLGSAGARNPNRMIGVITDTSDGAVSPYAVRSRQGAIIVPRCLFFVEETANPAIIQAGQTVTVDPRRGSQDKVPWKNLHLAAITGQTIEDPARLRCSFGGRPLSPYAILDPLKAVLPLKRSDSVLPVDNQGVGGVNLGALGQRMRARWQTVSHLWEENKRPVNKLDLLGQLDYFGKLSAQIDWQRNVGGQALKGCLHPSWRIYGGSAPRSPSNC